jgi:uncharacterized membrane protein YdjX (TVP38/TMEM64 family)
MRDAVTTNRTRTVGRAVLLLVLAAGLVTGFLLVRRTGALTNAVTWVRELGPWGPAVFIVMYVAAVLLSLPASILTLGAGFLFGMLWGSIYVLLAATAGAALAFLIGRYLARDWVANRIHSIPRFRAIDDAVAREGWKIVALVRLVPLFPFSIMSYAFGLTRIPFRAYFFGNFTMLPATFMYVYFGTLLGDITHKVSRPAWIKWAVAAVTAVVIMLLTRMAQRALTQRAGNGPSDKA